MKNAAQPSNFQGGVACPEESLISSITWVNTDPASTSTASFLDDAFRSFVTSVAGGLGESLNWPGTGGGSAVSAGRPKLGSARLSRAAGLWAMESGYLGLDTSRGALWHVWSTASYPVGHASLLDRPDAAVSVQSVIQQSETGSTTTTTAVLNHTFSSAFSAAPTILAQLDSNDILYAVTAVNASGFSSGTSSLAGATPSYTLSWYAEGYRST